MCKDNGKTQTTTEDTSKQAPAYVQAAQQNLIGTGGNMLSPFLNQPSMGIMGQNPDQTQAFDYARQIAMNAFNPGAQTAAGMVRPIDAKAANFKAGQAAQLGAGEYKDFMNPYVNDVVMATNANLRRQNDEAQAQIGGRMAAAGAFGGSREAVMRGQQNRAHGDQVATTTAQLMSQGYDKAQALALANAQMRQQTGMQNTAIENQMTVGNADRATDARKFNAATMPQVYGSLQSQDQANQLRALQALLGTGNQQQAFGQSVVDLPWTMLDRLKGITPSDNSLNQQTTKTSPDNSPSPLQQLLGGALTIGGMGVSGGGTLLGNLFKK
jgi:hypothetical protein